MIENKKLLLVEGKDEEGFFEALCDFLGIGDIKIIKTNGKERFKPEFDAIINAPGFEIVTSLGIVRDADNTMAGAISSINSSLKKHNMPQPQGHNTFSSNEKIKVGIFIAPGFQDNGMLENLVLETVLTHPVKKFSDKYIDDLKGNLAPTVDDCQYNFPRNEHKARLHSFLAGMEHYVPSLGIAAQKGYFNLASESLNDISHFLRSL
ncbi:hypothetical protein BrE312_1302 [Brenneria sp. EniD312]|nr:hypothetical protein BrE312_1302 [Brenneria sp. EniD312]